MKIDVLGVKVNSETKPEILTQIEERLQGNSKTFIVTPYSESLVAAQKDREFRDILNSADFALPDGIGVIWAAHFLKYKKLASIFKIFFSPKSIRDPIPEKISGSEFVWDLAALAAKNNYSIFLLGGFGDTPDRAATALKTKFPNLKIAGINNAPQPPLNLRGGEGELLRQISGSGADFLFVALAPIRQEKWIAQHLPNLPVKLAIGLGGTFDYLAGTRPYRGQFWASTGLEWLWRLLTQPWRVGRIFKGIFGLIYYCLKAR